jgi:CBS domain-containing protein
MSLLRLGTRHVATVLPSATAAEVARLMEEKNVGSVVVASGLRAEGIVTDRDLVLRVLRRGLDPGRVTAQAIQSAPLVTAPDDLDPVEAATRMRTHRIRRLPVVGPAGDLLGLVTLDDLVYHMGRAGGELSEVIASLPVPYEGG